MAVAKEVREQAARGEGCLGKATDDEPVFVLRAQDFLAPARVHDWADFAELSGCPAAKVADARAVAEAMRAWPTRKYPD